jgi:hypothetical protein
MTEETDNGQNDTSTVDTSTVDDTQLETRTVIPDQEGEQQGEVAQADKDSNEVPETYEFQMPEGVTINQGMADRAQTVFKELGLNQAEANKLTGMFAEQRAADAEGDNTAFREQLEGWVEDIKADPALGGEQFDENAGIAADAISQFGSPELRDMLNQTGFGNNPELFRFCLNVGKLLREDQPGSGVSSNSQGNMSDRMYGDTTPDAAQG